MYHRTVKLLVNKEFEGRRRSIVP